MNCMRIDPNYTTSKKGKHRKELKAALHERGYKCGQQMARELLRTLWYED